MSILKGILLLLPGLFSVITTAAQTETFGMLRYTPPPQGWQRENGNDHVKFTQVKNTSYCVLGLYDTRESLGTADKDFEKEWTDLAVTPFQAAANPDKQKQTTPEGWEVVAGASAFEFQGSKGLLMLTTIIGKGKAASLLAITNDTSYIPVIEDFLSKVDIDTSNLKKETPNLNSNKIIGKWSKSASSPPRYINGVINNMGYNGYYKGQYELKPNGTYIFIGEAYNGLNEFRLFDESGTYTVNGQQLTITPKKAGYRLTDIKGKLKKTEKASLTKRTYTWQFHYFEGIQETNLILTAKEENIVDGGFSSNSLFPNSFFYSKEYKPEWKFR